MRFLGLLLAVSAKNIFAQYCFAGPSSGSDSNFGASSFVGENTITYTPVCPGPLGVDNQTSKVLIFREGRNYTGSFVNYSSCGPYYSFAGAVWIDWNFNFAFDSDELITNSSGYPPTLPNQTVSFSVPRGRSGLTRMRIMMYEGGSRPLSPCSVFTWGGVADFTVQIQPGFCTEGGPSSPNDAHLNAFSLVGAGSTLSYTRACPGATGVENRTDLTTTLERGFGHRATIDVTTCGLQIASAVTVWIDYNQNHLFESDEVVTEYRGMPNTTTLAVAVPHTALLGETRIRVMVQEGAALPLDSCASFPYGAVVDFSATIVDPTNAAPSLTDSLGDLGMDLAKSLMGSVNEAE